MLGKLLSLPKEVYQNRNLVMSLAKNDFKKKFAGSYLGVFWAFVQPVITILVYWFVFQVALKSPSPNEYAYVLWLMAGLIPWFFFQEAIMNGTNAFLEYSYLVKKVVFKISILPMVKVISALYVHVFFAIFMVAVFILNGHTPDLYVLQIIYYSFCMFVFVLAVSYATSSVVIFFRDLSQIIGILLQVGVWATPIMWSFQIMLKDMPSYLEYIFKLNPMFYIVNGYRDAMMGKMWFWEYPWQTAYFWGLTAILFFVGASLFKKLKVHFSDVL